MRATNISNKIVGFGETVILPGECKEIPVEYERNPVLVHYVRNRIIKVEGEFSEPEMTQEEIEAERKAAELKAATEREELRQQRLASLNGIAEEDLAKLADELGINMAECKDNADIIKKVKAALKK